MKIKLKLLTCLFCFLFACLHAQLVSAQSHYWVRSAGTNYWGASSNWSGGLPVSSNARIYFRLPSNGTTALTTYHSQPYSLNFNYSSNAYSNVSSDLLFTNPAARVLPRFVEVGATSSRRANVTFRGSGTLGYSGTQMDVNTGSTLTSTLASVQSGSLDSFGTTRVNSGNFQVFGDTNLYGGGRVEINGGTLSTRTLRMYSGSTLAHNSGTLEVNGGSLISNISTHYIRSNSTSNTSLVRIKSGGNWSQSTLFVGSGDYKGSLEVDGLGSTVNTSTLILDGRFASTTGVDISNGGRLSTSSMYLGNSSTSNYGFLDVDGNASLLNVFGTGYIGYRGRGDVDITNGGSASFGNLVMGQLSGSFSELLVDGAGSEASIAGNLTVGNLGRGFATVNNGAKLTAGNVQITNSFSNSALRFFNGSTGEFGAAMVGVSSGGYGSFEIASGSNVNLSGGLDIGNGSVDSTTLLSGAGSVLSVGGVTNVGVNGRGGLRVISGASFNATNEVVAGQNTGSTGQIGVYSGGTLETSGTLAVGQNGLGDLQVYSGGVVRNGIGVIGRYAGSGGSKARVLGAGSRWENSGRLEVGQTENASLEILAGGVVTSARGEIGEGSGSTSVVTVDGVGSTWEIKAAGTDLQVNGNLLVGEHGNGTLNIRNGGLVSANTTALATQTGSTGVVNISGVDSVWENADSLYVGGGPVTTGGDATVNISGGMVKVANLMKVHSNGMVNMTGGTLDVGSLELVSPNDFVMSGGVLKVDTLIGDVVQNGGVLKPGDSPGLTVIQGDYDLIAGSIEFELGGLARVAQYDGVDVSGVAMLDGTMDVNFINGFSASLGDSFQLMNALGGITGTPLFDFSDATLTSGLAWNTSTFTSNGSIFVMAAVPEPGTFLLFGVANFALLSSRRKRSVRV